VVEVRGSHKAVNYEVQRVSGLDAGKLGQGENQFQKE
jgi:hypothetical protein